MRFHCTSFLTLCIALGCNSNPGEEDNETDSNSSTTSGTSFTFGSSTQGQDTTAASTGSPTTSEGAADVGSSSSAGNTEGASTSAEDSESSGGESTSAASESTATGGTGETSSTGTFEESSGSSGTGDMEVFDLFACAQESECDTPFYDVMEDTLDSEENAACVARAAASDEPTLVRWLERPDSYVIFRQDSWVFLRGDGTALLQTREWECIEYFGYFYTTCTGDPEWENPSEVLLCDVEMPEFACEEPCPDEEDCTCYWRPTEGDGLTNCSPYLIEDCDSAAGA